MYHVDVSNAGDTVFTVKSKDYEFVVDTHGKGITPPDTLLASLGSCIGVYVRKYCEGVKLAIGPFTVSLDAELSKDAPVCFRKIDAVIDFGDTVIDERRKKALLEFIKNCPVHNTLAFHPEVGVRIK